MALADDFVVVEAVRMAERGDASPHDIDTAMELGAGYRELCEFRERCEADRAYSYGRA